MNDDTNAISTPELQELQYLDREISELIQLERNRCSAVFLELYGRATPETIAKAIRAGKIPTYLKIIP